MKWLERVVEIVVTFVMIGAVLTTWAWSSSQIQTQGIATAVDYWLGQGYSAYADPSGNLLPATGDNVSDIGSAGASWRRGYFDSGLYLGFLTNGRIPIAGVGGLLGDDAALTWSGGNNPLVTFGGWNVASGNLQEGYLESHDYGGGGINNNIVLGAKGVTYAPNIRIQVDNSTAHIGFNIGGTYGSAATVQNVGGDGELTLRGANMQAWTDTTEEGILRMTSTSFNIMSLKGDITVIPFTNTFRVKRDGSILINTTSVYSNTATDHAVISLQRGRGTHALPTAVQNGDTIFSLRAHGQIDTTSGNIQTAAKIDSTAEGNFSSTSVPGRLGFWTTPTGSITPIEAMRLSSTGNMTLSFAPKYSATSSSGPSDNTTPHGWITIVYSDGSTSYLPSYR